VRNFKISTEARIAVNMRSRGICEACGFFEASHLHHLTYKRAGHELPEDLLHICTFCHCAAHPEKYDQILRWEAIRRLQKKTKPRIDRDRKYEFEQEHKAEDRRQEYEREKRREQQREKEHEQREPAWNLGRYHSNGYDIEEVAREDGFR
jgi:hypothetical protein